MTSHRFCFQAVYSSERDSKAFMIDRAPAERGRNASARKRFCATSRLVPALGTLHRSPERRKVGPREPAPVKLGLCLLPK